MNLPTLLTNCHALVSYEAVADVYLTPAIRLRQITNLGHLIATDILVRDQV